MTYIDIAQKIQKSQENKIGNITSTDEIFEWIENLNKNTKVNIQETSINGDTFWFYDDFNGEISNRNKSFFYITGMRYFVDDKFITEQPIIVQNEIGYLGVIAKEINGVLNFLMQAKIEPGNINGVQISPTIQATKSNFTQAHGGKLPLYFDLFANTNKKGNVIYDQIQSEQGTRFAGKRNRSIIILTDEDIPIYPNFKWMTLGQIKTLMKQDNLVNMDTRTVLSCLSTSYIYQQSEGGEILSKSSNNPCITEYHTDVIKAYSLLNNYKMYHDVKKTFVPLNELSGWNIDDYGITNKKQADFCVRYYNIEIQDREVQKWTQPLFKATSNALFVLFSTVDNGVRKFLISLCPEIGCFDKVEFGPSIQLQNTIYINETNPIHKVFLQHEKDKSGIITDVILSEEGGRFYQEQTRNMIIEIDKSEIENIPNYMWISKYALFAMLISNNVLNIQLRNLISLLDIEEKIR